MFCAGRLLFRLSAVSAAGCAGASDPDFRLPAATSLPVAGDARVPCLIRMAGHPIFRVARLAAAGAARRRGGRERNIPTELYMKLKRLQNIPRPNLGPVRGRRAPRRPRPRRNLPTPTGERNRCASEMVRNQLQQAVDNFRRGPPVFQEIQHVFPGTARRISRIRPTGEDSTAQFYASRDGEAGTSTYRRRRGPSTR